VARLLTVPFVAGVVGIAAACGPAPRGAAARQDRALTVGDAYAAEPATGAAAAVYFTVRNGTEAADTLVGAVTPIAATAGFHRQTRMGAMVHMEPVGPLVVPAGGELRLEPGGTHLMLEQLAGRPRVGDTIDVTLEFTRAGAIPLRVPVISYVDVSNRAAHGRR
jgi:periplasmic copper chaperone A